MDASTAEHVISQVGRLLDAEAIYQNRKLSQMSAIDRIREKALQARGVVPRVIASVEAGLDELIAAEPEIEKEKDEALAPHRAAIAETKTELAGVRDALSVLSNGGPPLQESTPVVPPSPPAPHGVGPTPVLPVNP